MLGMLDRFGIRKSIDEKRPVAFAVLPPPSEGRPPAPLILAPVSDFDKFLEAFDSSEKLTDEPVYKVSGFHTESYVRHIGDYAAVTDPGYEEVLYEKNLKIAEKVPADLAAWREWLAGHDAAGVILPPGIKFISANVQNGLRATQAKLGENEQLKSAATVFEMYGKILQSAEGELAGWGFGIDVDKDHNFVVTDRALLVPGGKWAGFVRGVHPARMNLLAGLPDGPFVAAGGAVLSEQGSKALMTFSMDIMKNMRGIYGLSEEQVDKMSELAQNWMKGIRSMSMLFQVGQSDEPLYAKMALIMRVDDSRQFMTRYEDQMKQYAEFLKGVDSPLFQPIEVEKTEVGGVAGMKMSMKAPQLPDNLKTPAQPQMMKLMFGPEGRLNAWIIPADEHTIVVGYVNQRLLKQTIEAVKQGKPGLAGLADVKQTAALLPSGPVAVGYVSPSGVIDFIKQIVPAFAPPGANLTFPEFPQMPPIGFAVTTAPNEVQCKMVVPGKVIQSIVQTLMKYNQPRMNDGQ